MGRFVAHLVTNRPPQAPFRPGLVLCSKSCDDYSTVAKICDDFAEPYLVFPTVQRLTLKGMIALIGYANNPKYSYRFRS